MLLRLVTIVKAVAILDIEAWATSTGATFGKDTSILVLMKVHSKLNCSR
jgi:hypothetical protein